MVWCFFMVMVIAMLICGVVDRKEKRRGVESEDGGVIMCHRDVIGVQLRSEPASCSFLTSFHR